MPLNYADQGSLHNMGQKKKSVSQREPLVDLHICNTFNSSYIWGNNVRIFAYVCQTLLLNLFAKSVLFTHIL